MKYIYSITLSILLVSCAKIGSQIVSPLGISCDFPESRTEILDTSRINKSYEYVGTEGDTKYTLRITSYGNNLYNSDSINNLIFDLNYSQNTFIRSKSAQLFGQILKTIKGYPGKEFRYEYRERINFRRVYIIRNNLVEMIYDAPSNKLYHTEIDDFFNSLKIDGFDENTVPFIKVPSKEEIANRPFTAKFEGDTKQILEVNETEFGNISLVLEMQQFKGGENHGVLAFFVIYMDFPTNLTETNRLKVLENHEATQSRTYPNFELLHKEFTIDKSKLQYRYTINGELVLEEKELIFKDDRLFIIGSLVKASSNTSRIAENFRSSVEIK